MVAKKKKTKKKAISKKKKNIDEIPDMEVTKNIKEKENKQLIWVLIIMGVIFAGFLGSYFYVQSLKTFEFVGIKFEKIKDFDMDFYHGRMPVVILGAQNYYNIYLRNDPRKNKIPINTQTLLFNKKVIISHSPDESQCKDADLAHIELSKFLGIFGFELEGGLNDKEIADAMNITYATCEEANEQTVIILQKSKTPSIEQGSNQNCYVVNVGDCESLKAIERFIMGIIAQVNGVGI